ncbi:MAG TPA: DUF72 domain-containing protein [Candidatus Dormibacteraeota bacterium]|nr:DUF72 domain-containing protein [Candidatus Dormibacteraeota bacterium]
MSELLVGSGGWAYFQVPGLDSLEAYSRAFNFVELNSSYYGLPSVSSASEWRQRAPSDFRFSVRCPRILVDHYGLKLLPGARGLLERLEEVCATLEAEVMTVMISQNSGIRDSELVPRLKEFLGTFRADNTIVAVELRNMKPSEEVFDLMRESGAVHSVDISNGEPAYESRVLYSRLFGKGEDNIYEFDDKELRDIANKASKPKFEKSILAFHGVRMYRDAGRVKSFLQKGFFPKITSGVGVDSIQEILSEDARFPASKAGLLRDQGWKVFQDTSEVRKISTVLEKLPDSEYSSLDDLVTVLRSRPGLFLSN